MEPHELVVLLAFVSLVVELTVFPIPSEASTYQLFLRDAPREPEEDRLSRARERNALGKLLLYFLPTAAGVVLFLIPLVLLVKPEVREWLYPVVPLETPLVAAIGALTIVAGRAITMAATLQLRAAQRRDTGLAARGLFTFSRNPGLVGMYAFFLGLALVYPCWVLFVGFVPYVFNMHRRVLMEESHLGYTLGSDYGAYLRAVPRYLPLGPLR